MMSRNRIVGQSIAGAGLLAVWLVSSVAAAELAVLSAGAIEPGVRPAAAAFEKQAGHTIRVTFNTAPQIRKRMADGEAWDVEAGDVVIAPPAMIE